MQGFRWGSCRGRRLGLAHDRTSSTFGWSDRRRSPIFPPPTSVNADSPTKSKVNWRHRCSEGITETRKAGMLCVLCRHHCLFVDIVPAKSHVSLSTTFVPCHNTNHHTRLLKNGSLCPSQTNFTQTTRRIPEEYSPHIPRARRVRGSLQLNITIPQLLHASADETQDPQLLIISRIRKYGLHRLHALCK